MGWIPFNPNPDANRVGDCTIRAISLATDQDWDSYRRGRDTMGRYTSRDGYSGHDKESMIEGLREKMHMATNESDREAIRRAIDILER